MSRFDKTNLSEQQPERVLLVGVLLDKDFPVAAERRTVLFESALAEAEELVRATGADLVEVVPCKRQQRTVHCLWVKAKQKNWHKQ